MDQVFAGIGINSYESIIRYLYALSVKHAGSLSLVSMKKLCSFLGNPHRRYPVIHVAGTNGKGSVVHKTAAALHASGYRVGVFTSPHIASYRERICIGQSLIRKSAVLRIIPRLVSLASKIGMPISFFELTTLLALEYFAEEQVDIAVIEVGLGGRLDATNVVSPQVSVITSIGYDHTALLGYSLEAIAKEKGGIIKQGAPVVLGPDVRFTLLDELAEKMSCPVHYVDADKEDAESSNQATAKTVLALIEPLFPCPPACVQKALTLRPACRFEICTRSCKEGPRTVILDVAHNEDGIRQLLCAMQKRYPGRPLQVLACFSKNKDAAAMLQLLTAAAEKVCLAGHTHIRLMDFLDLQSITHQLDKDKISIFAHLPEAFDFLFAHAPADAVALVCGSFFHMADVKAQLGLAQMRDPLDLNEKRSFPSEPLSKKR